MNSELVQTGFFEAVSEIGENDEIIVSANWMALPDDDFEQIVEDRLIELDQQEAAIDNFVKAVKSRIIHERGDLYMMAKTKLPHGRYLNLLKRRGVEPRTAQEYAQAVRVLGDEISNARNSAHLGLHLWVKMARSPEGKQIAAKIESGEIKATPKAINAELEAAKQRSEELQEEKQELQRSLDLFKVDREKERQELKNKLQAIEHEKAVKDDEILSYKQSQAALGDKARLNAKEIAQLQESLRSEASKQLDKDLEKQRQEQKTKFKEAEKELKALYAQKEQQYQLKAENTIRSLLSHGIKSMAETQLTIEHTVSAGMLQAVQQLGGKQVDSFLAQAESLQEEIDRVIAKLTHGDYLALEERISANG